jgi:hypothetical protein
VLGGGSFSTSKSLLSMGTIRSFRIEAKRFDIYLEVGNTKQVKIKESGKQHVNSVYLSKDGVRWLSKCVEEHVTREGEPSFLRTYRENDQGYVISRNGNNYGRFVELLAYGKGGLQGRLVIPEGQKQSGWRGFVSELRCALEPGKTVNLVASKPINMNTQQEKELNHGNKVAGGGGPNAQPGRKQETVDHSWRDQLFPHMEISEKQKRQEHDSSDSGGRAGKEKVVGFGAKVSDKDNGKSEVILNLKVKLTCDLAGNWTPSWVGLDEMDSKSVTKAHVTKLAQQPKLKKVWQPIGSWPVKDKSKVAQVMPGGSGETDLNKPKYDLKKPEATAPEISISNSFSIFQHDESSNTGEDRTSDPIVVSEISSIEVENSDRRSQSEIRVLPHRNEESKGAIVLCESPDTLTTLTNQLEVDCTWGSSSDWVLELRDGRRLSIPISLIRQPDVPTPAIPGMSLSGFGIMGPTVEDQHSMGSYMTSDAEENSEDDISLVWEDSEVVGDGCELVCWGDEVVPLEIEPLAISKLETISMEAGGVKEKEDIGQEDIPSEWVVGRSKRIGKLLGASYVGNEERVTRLLMEIDARRVQCASEGSMKSKIKVGKKGSRELKRLSCSINYESDSATARGNSRERVLSLSQ